MSPGTYWPIDELKQSLANNGMAAIRSTLDDAMAKFGGDTTDTGTPDATASAPTQPAQSPLGAIGAAATPPSPTPSAPKPQASSQPSFMSLLSSLTPWDSGQAQQPQQPQQGAQQGAAPQSFSDQLSALMPWQPNALGPSKPLDAQNAYAPAPARASGGAATPGSGSWEDRARAAAVAAGHPNPNEFVEQMRWESGGFAPDVISGARNSSAGAQGIAQIMPDVARSAGINPLDPDQALQYAAQRMANNYRTYGNSDQALAEYNMGSGNLSRYGAHGLPETDKYISIIHERTGAQQSQTSQPDVVSQPMGPSMAPGTYGQDLVPNQLTEGQAQGLTTQEALAVCGPAAAVAFARANGRNPTLAEAKQLAQHLGLWDVGQGMHGPASEVALLNQMGVPAALHPGADWNTVRSEVSAGRPVILDTPQHYYVATAVRDTPYGPEYQLGESANVLAKSRGQTWWRPDEIPNLGMGDVRAMILMGQPQGQGQ